MAKRVYGYVLKKPSNRTASTLRPYDSNSGRHFDFTEFEILGREFVSAFALGFVCYSSSLSLDTAQSAYGSALHFLRWLVNRRNGLLRLLATLRTDYQKATAEDWEDALALWQDEVISKSELSEIRRYNIIRSLRPLLKRLISFGVLPKITITSPPTRLRKASRPTRTLAELSQGNIKEEAKSILEESISGDKGTGADLQIKRDFLTTLLSETGDIDGTAEEVAKALMQINASRLAAIRSCAVKDFKKWRDHWYEGQHFLRSCDMPFDDIDRQLSQPYIDAVHKSKITAALFPSNDPETSLTRLLTYFDGHPEYCGRMRMQPTGTLEHWFWTQAKRFGVVDYLQAYLFPHPDLTTAIGVLILCDTGANVSVVRSLHDECLGDSKELGHKILKGTKTRAGGKLIINELPIRDPLNEISCIEAILTYQTISKSMRNLAKEKGQKLFLRIGKSGNIINLDNQSWTAWFRAFCDRHPELRELNIQSKMIRPSVLLQSAYDKEAGIIAAASFGDHAKISTTFRYVSRFPTQIIWAHKVRKFQSLFQATSIQNIKGAAQRLGLTVKAVEKLFKEACRTGLGVACLDSKAGIQSGSKKGEVCTQIQNCPTCQNSFVLATVENLKDLILWNFHLEQSRAEWETARPERWEAVWLPWLVFTQVAIEQASRGRTVKDFKAAKTLANIMINKGQVNLPPLW